MIRGLVVGLVGILSISLSANAETVDIEATRDTTLIEDPDGAFANGSGPAIFAGRTGQAAGGIRRALIHFDVASALPAAAIIEHVSLTLHLAKANNQSGVISLHPVLDDWGEGASSSSGGGGAPAQPGDATWIHTFYDGDFWARDGGLFMGRASVSQEVGEVGYYTWEGTQQLIGDVRLWLHAPHRNFGWALIGDEEVPHSAQKFDSRESANPDFVPLLTIDYRLP